MEIRNLGQSGLKVSLVGLGCNNFGARLDVAGSRAVIDKAIELGITLFDTADIYGNKGGSEDHLGQILGARRKQIVLATKFGMPMDEAAGLTGAARRYVMSAVEASLRRLKTDWIDLYQLHQPDPRTPIEETLRALDDLVRQGKLRYVGCSNLKSWQVIESLWAADRRGYERFVSCQDEYSLVMRGIEADLAPAMRAHGLGLLPFFPLACGLLTGKYRRGQPLPEGGRITNTQRHADKYLTERNWSVVEKLDGFAKQRGRTLLELAFSWLAAKAPVSSVIAGATKPEQVAQNVAAVGWKLGADELAEVDRLSA
ncbi:MAG: aldo/keto reductase [Alphaproteobacteria bacterium]|nr:aldo/keto reductase [Alphaproteobacteria bacterium]